MKTDLIAVVITAYNEEKNISEAIASAKLLTEDILVIDTESIDNTAAIAVASGAAVLTVPFTRIVEPTRNLSIEKATTPWVFLLDADERLTPELTREIKKTIYQKDYTHFRIKRKNMFGNQFLKHGLWWPDIISGRLILRESFKDWPAQIHSSPIVEGREGQLDSPLIHQSQGDLTAMVKKTALFEDLESQLLFEAHKKATVMIFFRKFFGEFCRRLIKGLGFLDGSAGIIATFYQAYSKTVTYLFLYEKNEKQKNRSI